MSYSSEIIQNALNQTQISFPTGMSMMLSTPYGFVPCYIPGPPQIVPEASVTENSTQVSADAWRHNISNLNNSIRPSVPVTPAQHPSKKRNNNRNLTVYGIVDLYKFSSKDYYFFYENVRSDTENGLNGLTPLISSLINQYIIFELYINNHLTTMYR